MSIDIQKDLRSLFGEARNQKRRPTCMAFASSDVHAAVRAAPYEALSAEYAYYHALRRKAIFAPDQGVSMANMMDALREDGQPFEEGWPYLDQLPSDIATYVPPTSPGSIFRRLGREELALDQVISLLDNDNPVVLALEISREFYAPQLGVPISAPPSSPTVGRHAMAAVGYGTESGQHVFLIRNSWGSLWGEHGHAWLTRHYVEPRLMSIGVYEK